MRAVLLPEVKTQILLLRRRRTHELEYVDVRIHGQRVAQSI